MDVVGHIQCMVNPFPLCNHQCDAFGQVEVLAVLDGSAWAEPMSWLIACHPSEVNKGLPPPLRTKSIPAKISCRFTHQAAVAWCHQEKVLANRKIWMILVRK